MKKEKLSKELCEEIWNLHRNIRRLRIKIEDDTSNPVYITTDWGYGYKWGA